MTHEPSQRESNSIRTHTVTGVCPHDCPDSCGWVVTVEDRPEGPVPIKLRGNTEHPYSQGELCPKVNRFLERAMSDDRILTPLRRIGEKGSGQFEAISWESALAEIAERWTSIIADSGPEAIAPFWDAGNQSTLSMEFPTRFVAALGMSRLVGSICGGTARSGTALTYGSGVADDPTEIQFARTILLWGTNTKLTNRHLWPYVEKARANGATVVVIDPIRTLTANDADVFLQPLPGTDVAIMLAIMHVLIRDTLIDRDYIDTHAAGFDELAEHVASWTPERAAEICGLESKQIEDLATMYGTQGPSFIRTLIGAEHTEHGATFFRTLAMLPVLIGAWKTRGGGFARSVGNVTAAAITTLERPYLAAGVERRALNMNHIGHWLNDNESPVASILIWNANPVISYPNTVQIRRGLAREDLFTVVHEQFMTDTARYADLVLPATTQIEQLDVMASWGSPHLTWNEPAIPSRGESVSNTELFRRLAAAMGMTQPELFATDNELVDELFDAETPKGIVPGSMAGTTRASDLRSSGTVGVPLSPQVYQHGGFATVDGKALLASVEAETLGVGRLPEWRQSEHGWYAAQVQRERFPFQLLTPKHHTRFLNTSYAHLQGHGDREGGPFVEMCGHDADKLGLEEGSIANVGNDRAQLQLVVKISERLRSGVVAIPYGWHLRHHLDGQSANSLTNDTLTNFGGGAAYNDTRVAIARRTEWP